MSLSASMVGISRLGERRRAALVMLVLAGLLLLTIVYSITIGRYPVELGTVWRILASHVVPNIDPTWTPVDQTVVDQVRLPRILAALLIGAGLSISGAALQGLFRNPLVDPSIVGVTSGAAFGGTLAILLSASGAILLGTAFGFGILSMLGVRFMATVRGRTSTLMLVLAGVIVSAFFEAAISIAKLMADPHQMLPAITYWLMGSVASVGYSELLLIAVAIIPAAVVIYMLRFQINILSLGEDKARALGAPVDLVRWLIFMAVAIISAGVVATCGIIGWVGLVIPHAARALVGADHGRLLPTSALIGGIYMIAVDDLARGATASEIPIGIITALVGVPMFAIILRRLHGSSGWSDD